MNLVTVNKFRGKFNYGSNKDQIQYIFKNLPDHLKNNSSFIFPDEYPFDLVLPEYNYSTLYFSLDLMAVCKKVWFFPSKKNLSDIIDWLKENEEEQEKLWEEKYINDLSKEKEELEKRLNKINKILNEKVEKNELG